VLSKCQGGSIEAQIGSAEALQSLNEGLPNPIYPSLPLLIAPALWYKGTTENLRDTQPRPAQWLPAICEVQSVRDQQGTIPTCTAEHHLKHTNRAASPHASPRFRMAATARPAPSQALCLCALEPLSSGTSTESCKAREQQAASTPAPVQCWPLHVRRP